MKSKIFAAAGMILAFIHFSNAQTDPHTVKKLEYEAKEYFKSEQYLSALPLYLKLDSLFPQNATYSFRTGVCYFHIFGKSRCLPYFQKAKKLGYKDPDLSWYIAHGYHLNHQFDEAISEFKVFLENLKTTYKSNCPSCFEKDPKKLDVERTMEMCRVGKELISDSLDLIIENMGPTVNSIFPEYIPVVSADEHMLLFTSRRPNTTGGLKDPMDDHYYEDIYACYKDESGKWAIPQNLGDKVNTIFHDACIGLSPDGHKLFIYEAGKETGKVYLSKLKGTEWTHPVPLGKEIHSENMEFSATISADEKTIYFSSSRAGGFGGLDIWYIKMKSDSTWSEPINMGNKINSVYDEDAPYIHPDNKTLFFSSNGHKSMGGYDIFTTEYNDTTKLWNDPENAGYPINTADNEIYFIWSADGTKGYFSAWRPDSYGEKDIYVIHRPTGTSKLLVLKGHIFDKETGQPLEANISVTDNETHEKVTYHSNSATGRYMVVLPHGTHYGISVEAKGYLFHSENFDIHPHNSFFEEKKDIHLKHLKAGSSVTLKNIFFDFGNSTIQPESKTELEKLYKFLKEHPNIVVEITGYSDEKEKGKFHEQLSQSRADAVVAYLVEKGIDKSRLVAKGHQEDLSENLHESEAERKQHRRTELTIIE